MAGKPNQSCAAVDAIAARHIAAMEEKIAMLEVLRDEMRRILESCAQGQVAACNATLSGGKPTRSICVLDLEGIGCRPSVGEASV